MKQRDRRRKMAKASMRKLTTNRWPFSIQKLVETWDADVLNEIDNQTTDGQAVYEWAEEYPPLAT